jgi:hypothetical protein
MGKRALIYIGMVVGALGTLGSVMMLINGVETANPLVAVFWLAVFGISLYYASQLDKNKN